MLNFQLNEFEKKLNQLILNNMRIKFKMYNTVKSPVRKTVFVLPCITVTGYWLEYNGTRAMLISFKWIILQLSVKIIL